MGRKNKKINCICKNCNKEFEVAASRINWGRGKNCSSKCQYSSMKKKPRTGAIRLECLNCACGFWIYKSRLKKHRGAGKYCSRQCRDEHWIGTNHPQFINGRAQERRGPNWRSQRRKAKLRDEGMCVECGMTDEESIAEWGQPLHVHHRVPFRFFDDYVKANDLHNLKTLCATDHRIAEAKLLSKQTSEVA